MGDTSPKRGGRRPTPTELEVWRLYIETSLDLKARMDRAMLLDSGLSSSDHVVLLALSRAEGRWLRTSELAAAIFWERSRLSHQVGRMVQRDSRGVTYNYRVLVLANGGGYLYLQTDPDDLTLGLLQRQR